MHANCAEIREEDYGVTVSNQTGRATRASHATTPRYMRVLAPGRGVDRSMMRASLLCGMMSLSVVAGCGSDSPTDSPTDREEALDFSLRVVETFVEADLATFESFLADTLYILEAHEPSIAVDELDLDGLFAELERELEGFTMEDYHARYAPRVLDYAEYSQLGVGDDLTYWSLTPDDFLFVGSELKPGQEEFILDDLLVFVVTKHSGRWIVRAMSS